MALMKVALLGAPETGKSALARALSQALASPPTGTDASADWQITDNPPLQQWLLAQGGADAPDLAQALAQQRIFDHTLLLALDVLPANASGMTDLVRMDTLLRRTLTQASLPFQVIYGLGEERLAQALAALKRSPPARDVQRKPWVWSCDKCSDPACEHRLLSDLLASRLP